jgi:hypothetical protein
VSAVLDGGDATEEFSAGAGRKEELAVGVLIEGVLSGEDVFDRDAEGRDPGGEALPVEEVPRDVDEST